MLSPPPWSFPNARVMYQPTFVPVEAARTATPEDGLALLSVAGYTLGGYFIVDWTDSPVGPYREVAVLSALVARGFSIGAWASHIFVSRPEAVDAGRSIFGLPAQLATIDFAGSTSECSVEFNGDDAIRVTGWRDSDWLSVEQQPSSSLSLSLPSFSGRLPGSGSSSGSRSPLLRYPLTLGPVRHASLLPALRGRAGSALADESLRALVDGPRPACPLIKIDGVDVVAGQPEVVRL